jgi:hypothetical protein
MYGPVARSGVCGAARGESRADARGVMKSYSYESCVIKLKDIYYLNV